MCACVCGGGTNDDNNVSIMKQQIIFALTAASWGECGFSPSGQRVQGCLGNPGKRVNPGDELVSVTHP